MQPRDNHLDNESDCAAVQVLPPIVLNQGDVDDVNQGGPRRRSRLVGNIQSPTAAAMLASPLTSTDDADAANQQIPAAVALVGARKRKALRVVKHAQLQVSFLLSSFFFLWSKKMI